jgi:hypothetical protein
MKGTVGTELFTKRDMHIKKTGLARVAGCETWLFRVIKRHGPGKFPFCYSGNDGIQHGFGKSPFVQIFTDLL